ncbi:gamma carbonic anhydrase family protein [bacterium]|nr:gamma carbonic anhydrase family protein [bacterium]
MSELPVLTGDPKKDYPHRFATPKIHTSALVFPGAQVWGDVHIGAEASIWFNSVVRGDVNYIRIGDRTNIQDLSMIHVSYKASPTIIGNDVTVGHSVVLHACTIKDFALIGMGSTILDDAEIGEFVLLGAGSLVTQGTKIPAGKKAFGRPAKVVGDLTDEEKERLRFSARHYVNLAKSYTSALAKTSS